MLWRHHALHLRLPSPPQEPWKQERNKQPTRPTTTTDPTHTPTIPPTNTSTTTNTSHSTHTHPIPHLHTDPSRTKNPIACYTYAQRSTNHPQMETQTPHTVNRESERFLRGQHTMEIKLIFHLVISNKQHYLSLPKIHSNSVLPKKVRAHQILTLAGFHILVS